MPRHPICYIKTQLKVVLIVISELCGSNLHVAVHADHADHADTAQSTGQSWVLHVEVFVSPGHAAPPLAGLVMIVRERV